jgi:hypothetical protein
LLKYERNVVSSCWIVLLYTRSSGGVPVRSFAVRWVGGMRRMDVVERVAYGYGHSLDVIGRVDPRANHKLVRSDSEQSRRCVTT